MAFNNNSSQCMFVGNRKLEDVIAQDTRELNEIRGSFKAIADRMSKIVLVAQICQQGEFDSNVIILFYQTYRGIQECPFGCRYDPQNEEDSTSWNEEVMIKSKRTGKVLCINSGTAHLVRVHHLLEKDNKYGISAREFYESFMAR